MGTQSREGLTMVHILTSVTLVLVSLELSLSAPFLLDLLPKITIGRREGKAAAVDSGYGAPESSAYEAPSYSTTTTTAKPCSYEAPQSDAYEAPQSDAYEAPHSDAYE